MTLHHHKVGYYWLRLLAFAQRTRDEQLIDIAIERLERRQGVAARAMNAGDVFTRTYQSGQKNFRRIVAIEGGGCLLLQRQRQEPVLHGGNLWPLGEAADR